MGNSQSDRLIAATQLFMDEKLEETTMVIIPNVLVISEKTALFILFAIAALFVLVPLIHGMVHRDEDTVQFGIAVLVLFAGIGFLVFLCFCSFAVKLAAIWTAIALFGTVCPLICGVVHDDTDLKQRGILSLPSLIVIGLLFYLTYVNLA